MLLIRRRLRAGPRGGLFSARLRWCFALGCDEALGMHGHFQVKRITPSQARRLAHRCPLTAPHKGSLEDSFFVNDTLWIFVPLPAITCLKATSLWLGISRAPAGEKS